MRCLDALHPNFVVGAAVGRHVGRVGDLVVGLAVVGFTVGPTGRRVGDLDVGRLVGDTAAVDVVAIAATTPSSSSAASVLARRRAISFVILVAGRARVCVVVWWPWSLVTARPVCGVGRPKRRETVTKRVRATFPRSRRLARGCATESSFEWSGGGSGGCFLE